MTVIAFSSTTPESTGICVGRDGGRECLAACAPIWLLLHIITPNELRWFQECLGEQMY